MPSDVVKLGMVGVGGWGKFVVRNFFNQPHCDLAYICDADPANLERQQALYPQATPTSEFRTLLDDPSVDAVAIVTPAQMHFDMARQALQAGKHVFVEKPMTLASRDAEELVELADRVDRKLMVGHLLEYHPAVELMKEKLDSGELGEIFYMYCQRLNLGVVRQHENAFWSLAPHDISVILYLFGQEPDHIDASGQSFIQDDVEDVAFATLHFPDGRLANIHVSWLDPHKKRNMVLVGSEKMMIFDDVVPTEKVRIIDKSAKIKDISDPTASQVVVRHGDIAIPHLPTSEPLALETAHFLNCILQDTTPRSDGRDGLRVVRVLEEVDRQFQALRPAQFSKLARQARRRLAA